jgi:hypothetical protein
LQDRGDWTQVDSDVPAHFIQVNRQIRGSRWYAVKNRFKMQGDQLLEAECPDLEQFVFAAVYFRQLFAKGDQLLRAAVALRPRHGYHTLPDGTLTPLHVIMALIAARDGSLYATTIYPFTLLKVESVRALR